MIPLAEELSDFPLSTGVSDFHMRGHPFLAGNVQSTTIFCSDVVMFVDRLWLQFCHCTIDSWVQHLFWCIFSCILSQNSATLKWKLIFLDSKGVCCCYCLDDLLINTCIILWTSCTSWERDCVNVLHHISFKISCLKMMSTHVTSCQYSGATLLLGKRGVVSQCQCQPSQSNLHFWDTN